MALRSAFTLLLAPVLAQVTIPHHPVGTAPSLPLGSPHAPPDYMRDNVNNYFGTAPDKGSMTGPLLGPVNASTLAKIQNSNLQSRQNTDDFWLSGSGSAGQMPFAPSGYQFFRNVKDFGAVGDGVTDDTAAINRAAATFSSDDLETLRCGADCGSTTSLGAAVYFPSGTYLISTPIIQYYYTQFIGNPTSKPIIKGSFNFTGIALFDSDFYIPGGNSAEWYINQSNFYRQIRNFVFDMREMNWTNHDAFQHYVPVGIHWQVGQATSITYCDFLMAVTSADGSQQATAVGIDMENGSGGFVSDLTFTGGNIGFNAGSQQFTANNLQFTSCLTAIKQVWSWGFTWKNLYVLSCYIAIDCTTYSGITMQGTGSITVLDSHFNGVPYAITVASLGDEQPNIVLDNLLVENSASVILVSGGDTILAGSTGALYFNSWASGYQYLPDGSGGKKSGFIDPAPNKPTSLLDSNGAYFTHSKPQYETETPIVATDHGVSNDGTSDQKDAINSLLSGNVGSVIFFPAGVYLVEGTIEVPVGSRIVGSGWSQIMGTGTFFQDVDQPNVMVQVGSPGDQGVIEISDMLFTVKGPTSGAILVEWNVHETSQGSAAMWDSHFRVGGADGSDLQLADCPVGGSSVNQNCMAASMLMHVTTDASGYFENVWAWVADHDLDSPFNAAASESDEGIPLNVETDVSIYVGRGILIESQGPTWLYGTASEHSQMYQYQLLNASNIYLGHMQTETPYYQPNPNALGPYLAGQFPSDPIFDNCADDICRGAWALRVLNSSDIFIYSAGFYSFFQNNQLGCTDEENCQLGLIETNFASGLWIYNIFTKGNIQIVSPNGGIPALLFNATTKDGYTSEIAAWLALSTGGEDIGLGSQNGSGSGWVTIDPIIWSEPTDSVTIMGNPPLTYVLPPLTLPTEATFSFPLLTTTLEVGFPTTFTYTYLGNVTTTISYVSVITTTIITIPAVTTSVISVFDVPVTDTHTVIFPIPSIVPSAFNITDPTIINGTSVSPNTRTFYPPPWPGNTAPPTTTMPVSSGMKSSGGGGSTSHDSHFPPVTHTTGAPHPTCTRVGGCGSGCGGLAKLLGLCNPNPCWINCPGQATNNWWDSNDPNRPNNPSSGSTESECETATFSSCSNVCIAATPTNICSPTCKDVVGCDTTGTELSTIFTPAPIYTDLFEDWHDYSDNAASDLTSDWAAGMSIWSVDGSLPIITGISTQPVTKPSPSSSPSPGPSSVQPSLPTSSGFWIGGISGTLSDGSTYGPNVISGPNQHIQCTDIAQRILSTMSSSTEYVIQGFIVDVGGPNTPKELAAAINPVLLESLECTEGSTCYEFCNGDPAELELAANHGDTSTPVDFMIPNTAKSLGTCDYINQLASCGSGGNDFTITYIWDCVGTDPTLCAGDY